VSINEVSIGSKILGCKRAPFISVKEAGLLLNPRFNMYLYGPGFAKVSKSVILGLIHWIREESALPVEIIDDFVISGTSKLSRTHISLDGRLWTLLYGNPPGEVNANSASTL
jgi:hypothetical protein